jgi:DNA-binding NarL/FixJ family response regulator
LAWRVSIRPDETIRHAHRLPVLAFDRTRRWHDGCVDQASAVRIVIVDAQAIAREGLKAMLCGSSEFQVVGECSDGRSALDLAHRLAPDLFVVDPTGLGFDGSYLVRTLLLCRPRCAVVVFAATPGRPVLDAFQAGARGVLLKSDGIDDVIATLRAVHAGDWCLSRAACRSQTDRSTDADDIFPFSCDERDRRSN